MNMPEDLARCLVLNTVTAARTLLRRYDAKLKPYGVTVQQFSLLATIRYYPGEPVIGLAHKVSLDRTSLTRNLDLLEGRQLIRRASTGGAARICELTDTGNTLLDQLLEEWQAAQSGLLSGIPPADADTYLRVAKHLSKD